MHRILPSPLLSPLAHIINKGREQQALCQTCPCFLFIFASITLLANYIAMPVGEGLYPQIFAKCSAAAARTVEPKTTQDFAG